MELTELFRLSCVIGLVLDIVYVIIDGIVFEKKYERGEYL